MALYLLAGGVAVAAISFMAGLFLFRIKSRWCPQCGTTLNCPSCMGAGAHRLPEVQP